MLPTFFGQRQKQKKHKYLYWELRGQQAVRMGKWKALRLKPDRKIALYDLDKDIGESHDVAGEHPDVVAEMADIFRTGRTGSEVFPLSKTRS